VTRLLHIADLHFGDESPALVEAFTTYCRDNPPDAIIATGDFTQAGRRREFDVARAFFDTLDAPIVGAPGNHDVPSYALDHRFITPWQRYDRIVGPVVQRSVITDQIHTETLHTARRAQMRPDWSLGRVSNRDLAALIAKFGPGPQPVRIAGCHHPLLAPDDADGRANTRRGREAAIALAPHCDLVLTGHLHRTFALPIHAPSHTCWFVGASTAFSARTRIEPAGFNEITITPDEFHLTRHIARPDLSFEPGESFKLARKP